MKIKFNKISFTALFVLSVSLFASSLSAQQWQPGSNMVFTNGNVGIGTGNQVLTSPFVISDGKNSVSLDYGALGFNRSVKNGYIYNSSISAWQFTARDERFSLEGYNGALPDLITFLKNGNVGIGTINPSEKLDVRGSVRTKQLITDKLFFVPEIKNNWGFSYLQWAGHSLVMGSPSGYYAHNVIELKPGGSNQGAVYSEFQMFSAPSEDNNEMRVAIRTNGSSFFNGGNVGIGTDAPTELLDVRGTIRANEIIVNTAGADFVFADDYRLRPLQEVEQFIIENKHLPDIASADSMAENGVGVSELQTKLLQKVEELTLYVIKQEKRIQELETKLKPETL